MQISPDLIIQYAKYKIHHLELDKLTNNTVFYLVYVYKKSRGRVIEGFPVFGMKGIFVTLDGGYNFFEFNCIFFNKFCGGIYTPPSTPPQHST
jgi:hypothetical protein